VKLKWESALTQTVAKTLVQGGEGLGPVALRLQEPLEAHHKRFLLRRDLRRQRTGLDPLPRVQVLVAGFKDAQGLSLSSCAKQLVLQEVCQLPQDVLGAQPEGFDKTKQFLSFLRRGDVLEDSGQRDHVPLRLKSRSISRSVVTLASRAELLNVRIDNVVFDVDLSEVQLTGPQHLQNQADMGCDAQTSQVRDDLILCVS